MSEKSELNNSENISISVTNNDVDPIPISEENGSTQNSIKTTQNDSLETDTSMNVEAGTLKPNNEEDEEEDVTSSLNYDEIEWFQQTEYIIFSNELKSLSNNTVVVLKECKDNKRLLDLKYNDLNNLVNNIQTSVIFFSTVSGFIQATRIQFGISDMIVSIVSISVATYITLLLSISKYYKLDEMKEQIQLLREKYSLLHNKLDHRLDILGPWKSKDLWIHQNCKKKLTEWRDLTKTLKEDYDDIIANKQELVTEFEIIMDTKSRNQYYIINKQLNYNNRLLIWQWEEKENYLEEMIQKKKLKRTPSSIVLQHEELDNWDAV